jgi:hypothetical protein
VDPRLWLSEATRRNFGRQERVEVVAAGNRKEAAQILAAHAQHLVCLEVKRYLDNTGSTIAALASYLGDKPDTLQRKFRGEQQASLADMVQWP